MGRKPTHPDRHLFDYLSGALDESNSSTVEQHLSGCADCASVAAFVRALKKGTSQISNLKFQISGGHPDVSKLAAFFYSKSPRSSDRVTAAHVALCQSCAEELAEYARAERAASRYKPTQETPGEIPATAWDMILDWEETAFAKPKPESETINRELLLKLSHLLSQQKEGPSTETKSHLVPVIIVDRSGEFRGLEMFEEITGPGGTSILKHTEGSGRFDNKPLHALLDFGEDNFVVVSDLVQRDSIRLRKVNRPAAELRRADYFIIED